MKDHSVPFLDATIMENIGRLISTASDQNHSELFIYDL
jgi:hypothetical protein